MTTATQRTGFDALSPRERQVVALVAKGKRNAEIGSELGIATKTVKVHMDHIFAKLRMHSRTQVAVAWLKR